MYPYTPIYTHTLQLFIYNILPFLSNPSFRSQVSVGSADDNRSTSSSLGAGGSDSVTSSTDSAPVADAMHRMKGIYYKDEVGGWVGG